MISGLIEALPERIMENIHDGHNKVFSVLSLSCSSHRNGDFILHPAGPGIYPYLAVIGGLEVYLFGAIAAQGAAIMIEKKVDMFSPRI